MERFLVNPEDSFWKIRTDGYTMHLNYGKLGYSGTHKKSVFKTGLDCLKNSKQLIDRKLSEGYFDFVEPIIQIIEPVFFKSNIINELFIRKRNQFVSMEYNSAVINEGLELYRNITDWKYANNDDVFSFIPFETEVSGHSLPGKILKKKYSSPDEARTNGIYSAGYRNNRLEILVFPDESKYGIKRIKIFNYPSEAEICSMTIFVYEDQDKYRINKVMNTYSLLWINDFQRCALSVAGENYYCALYTYNEHGFPVRRQSFSSENISESSDYYHYNDKNKLLMITTPSKHPDYDIKLWPRTNPKKSDDWKVYK